jgi:hypothetical protein
MALGALIEWLGLPGQIAALVSGGLLLYHGRSVLAMFGTLGFATKVIGAAVFAAFALVVLVPGVSVSIATATVLDWLAGVWSVATSIWEAIL